MKYHILTLFPEMIEQGLHTSILGRAINNGYISLETTNIRDFSANKFNRVDDYPYGGGAGMVMEAEPVFRAYQSVAEKIGKKPRTVYLTPQGKVLNQTMVEELALEDDLVLLCGHYEGIDDRVLQEVDVYKRQIICGVGALLSMVGDLAASAIKRNQGIKDYGKLIPGHGGILDRFDSVIFTAPIIYFLSVLLIH